MALIVQANSFNISFDEFEQQIEVLRKRFAAMLSSTDSEPISQQQLLQSAFFELHIALEELKVASEELHKQNSELLNAGKVLAVERQRYEDLFEEALEGYLVTDASAIIQEVNRAAAKLLNVSQKYLVGKPLDIFFSKETRLVFLDKLRELNQLNHLQDWQVRLIPRRGEPIEAALTVTAREREGKVVALHVCVRDITERQQIEEQLRLANEFEATLKRITDKVRDSLDEPSDSANRSAGTGYCAQSAGL